MSRMKSILGRRRKKVGIDVPKKYNGLYQFYHENIISDSLQTDSVLIGCDKSNTLYLEGEEKTKSIGFIFSGKRGCSILTVIKNRIKSSFPESLLLASKSDSEMINLKIPTLELPETPINKQTFSRGIKWFESNKMNISSYIERIFRDVSFIFLVLDNDAFSLGAIYKISEILKEKDIQIVLFLTLPMFIQDSAEVEKTDEIIRDSISVLSFIHYLMKKDFTESLPFILVDESKIVKNNPNDIPFDILKEKMYHREANLLVDFMIGTQNSSEFYHTDFGSFAKTFNNAKGLCNLLSLDIYDNNPLLSGIIDQKGILESYDIKEKPTRGYIIIQSGPEGLSAEDYHEIRKRYTNLDVVFSIQKRRNNGAIIRGILSYLEIPKQVLNRYGILSEVIIELLNEENEVVGYLDTAKLEDIWLHDTYKIQRILKEDKKE
ncbi:MAG: hypothetical protein HGN29_04120 [Asgard group archaeon]|nr:hypothetical protein [Asgard group archaeon]